MPESQLDQMTFFDRAGFFQKKDHLADAIERARALTEFEKRELIVEATNSSEGKLQGLECAKCNNRGWFLRIDADGCRICVECDCMAQRRNLARLERSGLQDMVDRYTFESWRVDEEWQRQLGNAAYLYGKNPKGWFFVSGHTGCGKTHICTALSRKLIEQGYDLRYILWRDFEQKAQASRFDDQQFSNLMKPIREASVIYLDDFLKTGGNATPKEYALSLAYEVINLRYMDAKKFTIISTELSFSRLRTLDEAMAGRIIERSKTFQFELSDAKNRRMI